MDISILIVDDEVKSINRLKKLAKQHIFLQVIGICSTVEIAIDKINNLNPDVVYLDTKINGFEIIEKIILPKKPIFIFTSSSNEFAAKAFDYFAFDYLLKPLKEERFYASIKKIVSYKKIVDLSNFSNNLDHILDLVKEKSPVDTPVKGTKINIRSGNKIIFLEQNSIKYIVASGYYVEIFTTNNKKFLLRESLSSIIKRLNSNIFIRIHRSTIINSNFIDEIITSNYGETDVKTNDNKMFRVSKSYKKEFQELMGVK